MLLPDLAAMKSLPTTILQSPGEFSRSKSSPDQGLLNSDDDVSARLLPAVEIQKNRALDVEASTIARTASRASSASFEPELLYPNLAPDLVSKISYIMQKLEAMERKGQLVCILLPKLLTYSTS